MLLCYHLFAQDLPLTEGPREGTIPTPLDQSRDLLDVTSYAHIPFLSSPTDSLTSLERLPEEQPSSLSSGCGKQLYIYIDITISQQLYNIHFHGHQFDARKSRNPPPTSGKQLHNNILTSPYYSYKNICISF